MQQTTFSDADFLGTLRVNKLEEKRIISKKHMWLLVRVTSVRYLQGLVMSTYNICFHGEIRKSFISNWIFLLLELVIRSVSLYWKKIYIWELADAFLLE